MVVTVNQRLYAKEKLGIIISFYNYDSYYYIQTCDKEDQRINGSILLALRSTHESTHSTRIFTIDEENRICYAYRDQLQPFAHKF